MQRGSHHTAEVRARISASKTGKPGTPWTPSQRAILAVMNIGRRHSPESIDHMRAAQQRLAPAQSERQRGVPVTHGLTLFGKNSPEYISWYKSRANARDKYRWKGIRVCERWEGRDGFVHFLADMGERPEGLVLVRIDHNGNYEPGNCKWGARAEAHTHRRARD
jgi:NUMOD3 motif